MSYKTALSVTAFGFGVFLQGCKDDEETECTVGCEDKCGDINSYVALTKDGTLDEDCVQCIGARPGVAALEGEADTDISRWAKALADAMGEDATQEQQDLPAAALNYCGAKHVNTACGTPLSPIDHVTELTEIDAAVVDLGSPECGLCYLLEPASTKSCATAKEALTKCGNAPEFDCDQDYSCHKIAGAYDDLQSATATAPDATCKTCLDAELKADTDITATTYAAAYTAIEAGTSEDDVEALADHLAHCGAEQHSGSCGATYVPTGTTGTDIRTSLLSADFNCELCVLLGEFDDITKPTCREFKTSLASCGSTSTETGLVCPECADFVVGDASCQLCLKEQNSGNEWTKPTLTSDIASYDPYKIVTDCGADVAAATSVCPTLDWSGLSGTADTDFIAAIDALNNDECAACLYSSIAAQQANACANFEAARQACSTGGAQKAC